MTSVFLLVDAQRNMLLPPEPVPAAATVAPVLADLLGRAREAGAVIVHVRNNGSEVDPDAPGTPGWQLVHEVRDGEHLVDKHKQDAFAGTPLAELVPASADVVVAGMQSEYCIRATSLAALGRGHRVTLVRDGHATYADGEPAEAISGRVEDELRAAGVSVLDSADITFA
ncbi:isochorismatase family protein [Solihabitans fulvus]|uniref:Isochorismatase family protein n=1 Tax=Solihabitans fulvus TaxID=1892852 RepID=A0A5B2WQA6_9PSEU|nr:isochorismatase family protein [Solihabitans fulvus]KAA2253921.1 isochorismatase family protein [Solihabitans fulvus]